MKNKKNWLGVLVFLFVLVFGMMVVGCEEETEDDKVIDSQFRGKWQLERFILQGTPYTLPCTINGVTITSGGYEINETSVKVYGNGRMNNTYSGYTEGNSFYLSDGRLGFNITVTGNSAVIDGGAETDYCTKVSKFSWE